MRNITVEVLARTPVAGHQVEIVERKGVGHPDSICDAIMERVSIALSREYLDRFGKILHHNIDKAFLVAGDAEIRLGGGRVTDPMRLIFGDRATAVANGEHVPVAEIAVKTARDWIRENLRFVDPEAHVRYDVQIKPGSPELVDIFMRDRPPANDTSAAVGYAPLTPTEQIVLEVERLMNSRTFKEHFPEVGEDIKVMGYRRGDELHLTAAVAMVDRYIDSEATYFRRKAALHDAVMDVLRTKAAFRQTHFYINTLDEPGRGLGGMYLSVTGTSAESGDSGQVGRGNKVNGVIALNRPMGTEAAAGKNPVSHVGKIYTIMTHQVANKIYREVPGVLEVYVWLLSQIGAPIDQPKIAAAQIVLSPRARRAPVERRVREVLDRELSEIGALTQDLAEGRYPVV
ncbi:MAG: methionine adenosyltransferase [Armatimonadota bacterium]|nr:methionine adenosyltransferase [Armatimonadota bacterium]MDR7421326.1 methionine adenosyltransferase [Armatimonadota bacterium]MDR7454918.1 methionine adenosyltransferase [Armatimonadota bacterium]MDR7457769.1 methionine adenosyltransferase [Armatimonadota bacterium]MDR7497656.1 methionine adenosyltransferase [Armatimonadota bacterium]